MKIAVVTGASSGIGREFTKQISERYSRFDEIWVIARRTNRLEELSDELKCVIRVISMDLTNKEDMDAFCELLKNEQPEIKLLINCAGYGKMGRVDELDAQAQLGMIDVNCKALTAITLYCLPYISKNSRIINVSSASAFMPQPKFAIYSATKSYVLSFSKALGIELKKRKITVTAVCPGPVDTEFFETSGKEIKFIKKLVMAKPQKVVDKALKDAALHKEVSVYGIPMKLCNILTRIVPDKLLAKFFE